MKRFFRKSLVGTVGFGTTYGSLWTALTRQIMYQQSTRKTREGLLDTQARLRQDTLVDASLASYWNQLKATFLTRVIVERALL
jgi:hypothetical protein